MTNKPYNILFILTDQEWKFDDYPAACAVCLQYMEWSHLYFCLNSCNDLSNHGDHSKAILSLVKYFFSLG